MNNLVLFEEKQVRRVWHEEEWWFVITDVVAVLTDSADPVQYLKKMRRRDSELNELFKGGVQFVPPLALPFDTGNARKELEKKSGRKVSTRTNYKELPESRRRLKDQSGAES